MFDSSVGHLVVALGVLAAVFALALLLALLLRRVLARIGLHDRVAAHLRRGIRVILGPERTDGVDVEGLASRALFWGLLVLAAAAIASFVRVGAVGGVGGALLDRVLGLAAQLGRAMVLLLVAWALASLLRRAVHVALDLAGIDDRTSAGGAPARMSAAVPEAVYWVVFLLFLPAVLAALDLGGVLPVQRIVDDVVRYLPNVLAAAVIFVAGWLIARIVRAMVTNLTVALGLDRAAERFGVRRILGARAPSAGGGRARLRARPVSGHSRRTRPAPPRCDHRTGDGHARPRPGRAPAPRRGCRASSHRLHRGPDRLEPGAGHPAGGPASTGCSSGSG